MKCLITGGAGFIGSALIREIITTTEHSVLNVDALTYAGNLKTVASVSDSDRYSFYHADIRDKTAMEKAFNDFQPDQVFHLAAESHVDRSIEDGGAFITTNINGTHTLLEVALSYYETLEGEQRDRFRFIHISTDEVYGALGFDDAPFDVNTPYAPNSPYSASKAASDHLVHAWNRTYKLPTIITHCSNNYGPYQYPEKLIPVVINSALNKEKIPVYGEGKNIRDWIHVEDHVKALLTAADKGEVGETYNIGGENEISNLELVQIICDQVDALSGNNEGTSREFITFVEDRKGHDLRYAISNDRAETALGWKPEIGFETGLKTTIEWYLKHPDWLETSKL